jgi:hypothetical protein
MCKAETPTPPKPGKTPGSATPKDAACKPCHPVCTLSSQTIATSPANRARTRIGVGEEVKITIKGNPATWAITSGTGTLSPNTGARTSVTFTADDAAGSVTVTATGSGCSCVNTITFTIVQPSNWTMKRKPGSNLRHTHNRPSCGWRGIMYIHPNDVNFYRVQARELDSQYVGTGSYSGDSGDWHGNYPPPDRASEWVTITMANHTDADGSKINAEDNIDTGDGDPAATGSAPPFNVGAGHFVIVFQWKVTGSANLHNFPSVRQEDEIFSTGRCESRKGGNTEFTMWNDPTSTP